MSSSSNQVLTGGCRCGSVTYTSSIIPSQLTNCYCVTCRRLSGAPFQTWAELPVKALTFKSSSLKEKAYSEIARRQHCTECGSPITMQYNSQPDIMYITAGSISEEKTEGKVPQVCQHIFLSEKAEWWDVPDDGVPRFNRFPGQE